MKRLPTKIKKIYDGLHSVDRTFLPFGIVPEHIAEKHKLSEAEMEALVELAEKEEKS
jgi:hypothetical protein